MADNNEYVIPFVRKTEGKREGAEERGMELSAHTITVLRASGT